MTRALQKGYFVSKLCRRMATDANCLQFAVLVFLFLTSFFTHLGQQPTGDCVREMQIGQNESEGVLMYVERFVLFKAKEKNTIKNKKERAQLVCALSTY